MDALVYEDTPIADYFEGEATPYDLPREDSPDCTPFAPRGLPDLRGRLKKIRRSATSIAPGSGYTEELLERFRYVVVASQLLSDEAAPRASLVDHESRNNEFTTLKGVVITTATSLLLAWIIHRLQSRKRDTRALTCFDVGVYTIGLLATAALAALLVRMQYTNHLQRVSARRLSRYVDDSHNLDTTATDILRFIQEVETVARGYELGSPLPPISRLEDRQVTKRCQILRRELAATLKLLTIILVENHSAVQKFVNKIDVQRYHDIYEVSLVEYSQALALVNRDTQDSHSSIKELRFAIKLHASARRVFLCDLLALHQTTGWARFRQWNSISHVLQEVETATAAQKNNLSRVLAEEEWGVKDIAGISDDGSSQQDTQVEQESLTIKRQFRQFNDITLSIRGLNAKVHLLREEINHLTNTNSEDSIVSSALSKHYESVGSELRSILADWERGKSCMVSPIEINFERGSCSSGSVRTPISESPSLTNIQIVDGGPADALRLLNGDFPVATPAKGIFQEEVFEAVASRMPRKRMSIATMTREEKMARLAEERRKRATLQEQSENTTNMLRELQMVIKHRPKGSLPYGGANNSGGGHRVATL